ncbi:zinc finger, C3HC4 type (RING finger) domain-containing protein [Cryptosporidium felis]|nr:zinc finger, C3HC4 type (RING finger) domain-containing protein [Cryptosporidium felis]
MIGFGINDAILGLAFMYSSADLISQWDSFSTCCHPIQLWLIISYITIIAFRVVHYVSSYLTEGSEEVLPYSSTSGVPFWLNLSVVCLIFPFFLSWTVVGTIWFKNIETKTPECLARSGTSHPWFLVFWLVLCYIWIAAYTAFIGISIFFEFRVRRAEEDLLLLENDEVIRRWGRLRLLADYGIHFIKHGLTPVEVAALPVRKITSEESNNPCSICIEDFKINDEIRTLPACGHSFHKGCIDAWLLRNAICPNCKTLVRYGKTETGTSPCRGNSHVPDSQNSSYRSNSRDTMSTIDTRREATREESFDDLIV